MNNLLYVACGIALGTALTFYHVDTPRSDDCGVYRVKQKVATAYVLKPPPAPEPEHVFCPTPIAPKPVVEEVKTEEPVVEEEKPRRRHRHHRWRRYWR